jgi:hypothetical protein
MIWILCLLVSAMSIVFASVLLSCLFIAKRSDEQIERLDFVLSRESSGSMRLTEQDIERFFATHAKVD